MTVNIQWFPTPQFHSVLLTNTSLETDSSTFNMSTENFRISFLFIPDSSPSNPSNDKTLFSKWTSPLANEAGWRIYYNPTDGTIAFDINDGSLVPITVVTPHDLITAGVINVVVVEVDRAANVVIYINGVYAAQTSLTGLSGSVDSANKFYINQNANIATAWAYEGYLSYFRFAFVPDATPSPPGTTGQLQASDYICGPDYALEEYYRLIYGCSRLLQSTQDGYVYLFENNLQSEYYPESDDITLTKTGGGSPTYAVGDPWFIDYDFDKNFNYQYGFDYAPSDTIVRNSDNSAILAKGTNKISAKLSFSGIGIKQKTLFEGLYYSGRGKCFFYMDKTLPRTMIARVSEPPSFQEKYHGLYFGDIYLEEL